MDSMLKIPRVVSALDIELVGMVYDKIEIIIRLVFLNLSTQPFNESPVESFHLSIGLGVQWNSASFFTV